MDKEIKIKTKPTEKELIELKSWLKEEREGFDEGFFCNWQNILDSFKKSRLIILILNGNVIGFSNWYTYERTVNVDLFEVHPLFRNQGLGKIFFDLIEIEFKQHGFIAIVLFCEPRESEKFWRKMEFIKFPNIGFSISDLTFYKPLIEVLDAKPDLKMRNLIELWNVEPHLIKDISPKWTWSFDEPILPKPIMQPCNPNWFVRWTKDGEKIEGKIKYLSRDYSIENGQFLFIEKLK